MRRAASVKQCCRNVCERVGKTRDTRPWEGNRPPSSDTLQEKLDTLKRKTTFCSTWAIMSTYVDDGQMDGNKPLDKSCGQVCVSISNRTMLQRNTWHGWLFHQLESLGARHISQLAHFDYLQSFTGRQKCTNQHAHWPRQDKRVLHQTRQGCQQCHVHAKHDRFFGSPIHAVRCTAVESQKDLVGLREHTDTNLTSTIYRSDAWRRDVKHCHLQRLELCFSSQ